MRNKMCHVLFFGPATQTIFSAAVPFGGQAAQIASSPSPKRDSSTKRVSYVELFTSLRIMIRSAGRVEKVLESQGSRRVSRFPSSPLSGRVGSGHRFDPTRPDPTRPDPTRPTCSARVGSAGSKNSVGSGRVGSPLSTDATPTRPTCSTRFYRTREEQS